MNNPMQGLVEAVQALRSLWGEESSADGFTGAALVAVNEALGVVKRYTDAVHAPVAARIAEESRPELGAESLAKQQGYRNAALLIAAATGSSTGDASRLVKLGEATAQRMTFTGQRAPARHPHVADALNLGQIGAPAAARIVAMLDRVVISAGVERMLEGERLLADKAPGLNLDQLGKLIARVEAWLDPDGVEPREDELRAQRSLTMFQRDGKLHVHAVFDLVSGAPIKAAFEGYVSAQFHARKLSADVGEVDEDRRTVPQLQADALQLFAEHMLGCAAKDVPLNGARERPRERHDRWHRSADQCRIGADVGCRRRDHPLGLRIRGRDPGLGQRETSVHQCPKTRAGGARRWVRDVRAAAIHDSSASPSMVASRCRSNRSRQRGPTLRNLSSPDP